MQSKLIATLSSDFQQGFRPEVVTNNEDRLDHLVTPEVIVQSESFQTSTVDTKPDFPGRTQISALLAVSIVTGVSKSWCLQH